ncbi:U32 family peptidase [Sinorhizobium medicae]|uniref:ubiquinone anaerobic biosynthesis protein UbiV n=1 Tax=Sinorhizobium medicae TaxID=110321 RepID=UPI00040E9FC3|nr:U32 family peptidase [Sinorhizobium medicae]MDX0405020.1 U32 family peptidase [Sinorhizobium medicae]MDX0416670.1 U32 family peptidase [Sinorhizobium medicae]MDX0431444.1 U32 family peptidase [Sinorhizobium medicae]MDX0435147.1 U32 family peptidase [Sinorhizobium medicae]MDX0447928.1 U32 family peptidase [Sinorhizobium medicae]
MNAGKRTLTLGPVLYLWEGEKWRDFYFRIADEAPVSHVVIGETVCSKRLHFTDPYIAPVIERMVAAGKRIVFSTLALVTLERESQYVRSLIADSPYPVEANDLSALALLEGEPHWIGPLVNVYNAATARVLARRGAGNVCLPPELPASSINEIVSHTPGVDFEVLAFGRMPLAISARCAHARAKGHIKDNCQFVCKDDPDGLPVKTLDRQSFLALNCVQTVSFTCQALLSELSGLVGSGVSRFRLSPQDCDMVAVARLYNEVLHGRVDAEDGLARSRQIYPAAPLSNGFHHGQEGAAWIARARNVAHGANA